MKNFDDYPWWIQFLVGAALSCFFVFLCMFSSSKNQQESTDDLPYANKNLHVSHYLVACNKSDASWMNKTFRFAPLLEVRLNSVFADSLARYIDSVRYDRYVAQSRYREFVRTLEDKFSPLFMRLPDNAPDYLFPVQEEGDIPVYLHLRFQIFEPGIDLFVLGYQRKGSTVVTSFVLASTDRSWGIVSDCVSWIYTSWGAVPGSHGYCGPCDGAYDIFDLYGVPVLSLISGNTVLSPGSTIVAEDEVIRKRIAYSFFPVVEVLEHYIDESFVGDIPKPRVVSSALAENGSIVTEIIDSLEQEEVPVFQCESAISGSFSAHLGCVNLRWSLAFGGGLEIE